MGSSPWGHREGHDCVTNTFTFIVDIYIHIYLFFFRFFSLIVYYKILNIVPYAIQ